MLTIAASARLSFLNASRSVLPESPKHGLILHPKTSMAMAYNVGSYVRPEIAKIAVRRTNIAGRVDASETVASFLARGGQIAKCAPCLRGQKTPMVKSKPTRFATSRG